MEIAVVIVNYNTCALLRRCLASVFASPLPDDGTLRVVVIDNASHDGSAAMVAGEFPDVELFALSANLGFTGGNNLALHALGLAVPAPSGVDLVRARPAVPPAYVLLLNPDAELMDDALVRMVRVLEHNPSAGACGAHLLYPDGRFQHGAFHFPTLAQVALDLFPLAGMRGAHRLLDSRVNGRYPGHLWQGTTPFAVDFVLGAALTARAEAIQAIGGLDDGYFMYCEEMDWCLRLAEAGWQVLAVPDAHVVHHAGQSSRQVRWEAYERLWRSRLRFYRKHRRHYPPGHLLAVRGLIRAGAAWQAWAVRRHFAAGQLTGREAARALAAYATLSTL